MSKQPLPSIAGELTPAPRRRLDLARLQPRDATPDAAVEANSRSMGEKWGASTQIATVEPPPPPLAPPLAPVTSIRGYIPQYLDDALSLRAAERRVTKTFLIMEALAQAGYRVDASDLVQDRRRHKKKGN